MNSEELEALAWDPEGPSQQVSWDSGGGVPGFGVRVYESGSKSFVVWVRNSATGRKRLVTVGRVGEMSLPEARDEAARISHAFKEGRDPAAADAATDRPDRRRPGGLTPSQVLSLLAAVDAEPNPVVRAALRLYTQTDLTRAELLRAEWSHVDLERAELHLPGAGGDDGRAVPLSPEAISILESLSPEPDNPYVFTGRGRGSHIADVARNWRAARARAGIEDASLDDLRHAVAAGAQAAPPARTHEVEAPAPEPPEPAPQREKVAPTPPSERPGRRSWAMPWAAVGVEIGPGWLRAYRPARRRRDAEAMEVAWGTPVPESSIAALRERFGSGNVVSVAVDMGAIHVKRLELPPLPMEERRRIITMDPRRYFPIVGEDLVAGVRDDDLVIATARPRFDHWLEALSALGAVERVESAPTALVRHLARGSSMEEGVLVLDGSSSDVTVAGFAHGSVAALRKLPAGLDEITRVVEEMGPGGAACVLHPWDDGLARALEDGAPGSRILEVPAPPDAPESFAVARGALLGLAESPELTLVSPTLERRLRASGRRRAVLHVASLVAAVAVVFAAVDHRRSEKLGSLERAIASATAAAVPVMELSEEATAISEQLSLLAAEMADRSNPLEVLLEATRLLPPDAYVTQLSYVGDEWELNGMAEDAARLIPLLEQSPRFADVRFRTATTRVRVSGRTLERFSLVLRRAPTT